MQLRTIQSYTEDSSRYGREEPILYVVHMPQGSFSVQPKKDDNTLFGDFAGDKCDSDLLDWAQWLVPKIAPMSPQIIFFRSTMERMSSDEQQGFEDLMKQWDDEVLRQCAQVREEVKEIFLSHFMVDRHQKIIKQGEIKLDSLVTSLQNRNVSNPNENQSIKHYID